MSFLPESELFTEWGLVLFILVTSELSSAWCMQVLTHYLPQPVPPFHFSCCITIHVTTHSSQLAMLTPHFPLLFLPPLNNHKVLPVIPADYFSKLPFTSIPILGLQHPLQNYSSNPLNVLLTVGLHPIKSNF